MVAELQWVHSSLDRKDYDEDTRRVIRAHAMKQVAAARKNSGTWGKKNRRQCSVIRHECTHKRHNFNESQLPCACACAVQHLAYGSSTPKLRVNTTKVGHGCNPLVRSMPLSGYELLVTDIGLDVLDLDELTCISAGQRAATILSQDSSRLKRLIARRRESYLVHLPARYGRTACLEDALRYLATKARQFLSPTRFETTPSEFKLYGKALRSLQAAIDDGQLWINADVLCAIEILSICEVLKKPSGPEAWESHVMGAYRLMGARGPARFTSDFEKSLIVSMIGPIISECMRLRQPCFFEEPAWQSVLRSVIVPGQDFSPRCKSYYELSVIGARIPRLFSEIYHAATFEDFVPDDEIDGLESRCRAIKRDLGAWRKDYDVRTAGHKLSNSASSLQADMRSETLCAGLVMQSFICRLLGTTSASNRITEEEEAVMHARHLVQLYKDIVQLDEYASFYIRQKLVYADSILATSDLWLRGCMGIDDHEDNAGIDTNPTRRIIDKWKFLIWCDGMPLENQ